MPTGTFRPDWEAARDAIWSRTAFGGDRNSNGLAAASSRSDPDRKDLRAVRVQCSTGGRCSWCFGEMVDGGRTS
jgi:hypothetical protein